MNNNRRREITNLIKEINNCIHVAESIRDDEQDYLDNMPENMQSSLRADIAQDAIDNVEEAIESLEDAIKNLEEAKE